MVGALYDRAAFEARVINWSCAPAHLSHAFDRIWDEFPPAHLLPPFLRCPCGWLPSLPL